MFSRNRWFKVMKLRRSLTAALVMMVVVGCNADVIVVDNATATADSTTSPTPLSPASSLVVAPSNLSYSTSPAVYSKGTAVLADIPTSAGDAVIAYSVAPALPAGLNLDPSTGVISGTPTSVVPLSIYTITAANAGGTTTLGLPITVNDVAPSGLTYSQPSTSYTKGSAIPNNTPSNSGGTVISYSVSPTLPVM
ncbi:putative Ig domain-containing protein [Bdellovibrionota bacterium FG-2]